MKKIITKRDHFDVLKHQINWYAQVYDIVIPRNITHMSEVEFKYDFVEGRLPTCVQDVRAVSAALQQYVWCKSDKFLAGDKAEYLRYIREKNAIFKFNLYKIEDIILNATLTPVSLCHGDPTLENIIMSKDRGVVFIDPGCPRGLPCKEIDEAKILQSLDGWHDLKNPGCRLLCSTESFAWNEAHWALLATHYIRLLHHPHPIACHVHAVKRILEITEKL